MTKLWFVAFIAVTPVAAALGSACDSSSPGEPKGHGGHSSDGGHMAADAGGGAGAEGGGGALGGGGGGGPDGGGGTTPGVLDAIVMGQSNAAAPAGAGQGPIEYAMPLVGSELVTAWDGAGWVMADPDGIAGEGAGVGQWFGAFAFDALTAGNVVAVRCVAQTQGGTSIVKFLPGTANWEALVAKVQASGAEPSDFFWWQGEANYTWDAAAHLERLETLRDGIHAELPSVERITAFQIAEQACTLPLDEVRAALLTWAASHDDVELVDLDDLTGNPTYHDGCHYQRAGYFEAGARLHDSRYP